MSSRYTVAGTAGRSWSPRLVAGLMGDDANRPPLGRDVWGDTQLVLPDSPRPRAGGTS